MFDIKKFNKLEYINRGSFSEVYKVQDKETQEFFAMKVYNKVILKNRKKFDFVKK